MKNKTRFFSLILSLLLGLVCMGSAWAEGILPVLQAPPPEDTYAISLQSATGVNFSSLGTAEGGGYKYNYSGVSYACYTRFSQKLAEEGYMLVSAETLEDGTSRAVVTDGTVTLVMDYNLENETASVSYPPNVFARDAALFDDYTEIRDGDVIQLTDHATAKVTGWQWKHKIYKSYEDKSYFSLDNTNYVLLRFEVDYFRPQMISYANMLHYPAVYYDGREIEYITQGKLDTSYDVPYMINNYDYKYGFEGKMDAVSFVLVFTLTNDQLLDPEKIAVTFSDYDNAVRYVYRPKTRLDNKELTGVWYGTAASSDEGAAPMDLRVEIWPDGSAYFAWDKNQSGSYADSKLTTVTWPGNTISVNISNGGYKKAAGTFDLSDGVLTLDLTIDSDYGNYAYKAELRKQAE